MPSTGAATRRLTRQPAARSKTRARSSHASLERSRRLLSQKNNIVSLEARYLLSKVAIAAIVSRNLRKDVTTVEVPVYFLGNPDTLFNGGVRIGWESKEKKVTAGVFVGAPFDFY